MALTTTQVNAAFVALLGRAAEGNANAWAANSADTKTLANAILSVDSKFENNPEQAKTNEDFVDALYQQVLGRAADADGKAFWASALANGTSRDELKASFLAAAKANNEDLTTFYNANEQFLSNVYSALLNRGVDNSGLEFWMNLLQNGVSRAEVVASIIEAINANPASEDYAIYNAKMNVANAVTAAFAGPKAGLNAEQSKALNDQLVNIMNSVTSADVKATDESIKAAIDNTVGSYGKEAAPLTFKAVTENMEAYELGNAESTTAQTFKGTINLQNADKSTISNKATLNTSNFSDTLVVDVIPSTTGTAFNYSGSQVETFAALAGIKNLTINNGTANITNLDSKGISGNLKITGAANVSGSVTEALQYLEVNTGGNANATATIAVNANLKEYLGKGSGKDILTVSGTSTITVDKISTGAGDDSLLVSGNGTVKVVDLGAGKDEVTVSGGSISGATINLGAGDDTFTFNSGNVSGATIDGGAGTDTLILSGDASAIKSLTSFEKISLSNNSNLSLDAFKGNIDSLKGATLAFGASASSTKLTLDASGATTIDLSKVVKDTTASSGADIELTNVGSGATTDVTVKLNKDDAIVETISLKNLDDGKKVTINGFVTGSDKLKLASGASVSDSIASSDVLNAKVLVGKAINDIANIIGESGKVHSDLVSKFSAATSAFSSAGQKGYIAQVKDEKTYLYEITNDGTATKAIDAGDHVKLIATFNTALTNIADFQA